MAKLSTDALLDAFKEMTLLELSEFVKVFEETFDVTAAAPVAVAVAAPAGAGRTPPPPPRLQPRPTRMETLGRRVLSCCEMFYRRWTCCWWALSTSTSPSRRRIPSETARRPP